MLPGLTQATRDLKVRALRLVGIQLNEEELRRTAPALIGNLSDPKVVLLYLKD